MSQLRKHPFSDRWILVAKNREGRPEDFQLSHRRRAGRCPFCAGHEHDTPPAIRTYSTHQQRGSPWQVRVVPNKYPAIGQQQLLPPDDDGVSHAQDAFGQHEIIVESPDHLVSLTQLDDQQAALVFQAYRDRLGQLKQDPRLTFGLLFKNVGAAAGASLEHIHSQLVALPMVPKVVAEELQASLQFHRQKACCIFCRMLRRERLLGLRLLVESPSLVAFCPYASRFPYETWIVPREHASHFENTGDRQLAELAQVTRQVLSRLESILPQPAYNYLIHSAPFDTLPLDHYHWHIEIIPRVANVAGFEWGTGYFINVVPPEEAAAALREARPMGAK